MAQKMVVISLDERELMQFEGILTDADKDEALRFLHEVIKPKTGAAQQKICGPAI